jgi:hypothetical protein
VRILTVRQPWAWAIIHGGKDVENRVRSIAGAYRGPVAIHASAKCPPREEFTAAADVIGRLTGERPLIVPPEQLGSIVGLVDLTDSHSVLDCIEQQRDGDWLVCSAWAERQGNHLVLANPRPLARPIPFRGGLGLRRLDDATAAAVLEAAS